MQTFEEGDLAGDGIISREEWHTLVINSPDVIGYMTLPVLDQASRGAAYPHSLEGACPRQGQTHAKPTLDSRLLSASWLRRTCVLCGVEKAMQFSL